MRKTTTPSGTPDFMLAYHGVPIAIEAKLAGEKLRQEQEEMRDQMTAHPNGWRYFVIRSIDDVRAVLRSS